MTRRFAPQLEEILEPLITTKSPEAGFDPAHHYEILRKHYRLNLADLREQTQSPAKVSLPTVDAGVERIIQYFAQMIRRVAV